MTETDNIRPHPGQLLKNEILKPRKLSIKKSAELLGVSNIFLSYVVNGRRDISLDLCHRIAILFNENAEDWATKQMQHNLDKIKPDIEKLNLQPYKPK